MATRTYAALINQMNTLLDDNNMGRLSAADLRSVLRDIIDSLAFKANLVGNINTLLGNMTWQQGGGTGGGGLDLQAVLNAILVSGHAQNIELYKDTSVADKITITIRNVAVASHTRYAAILENTNENPADFTANHFTQSGATQSNTNILAAPAYTGSNAFVTLGIATPARLTGVQEQGNTLVPNIRDHFMPDVGSTDVTIAIPGAGTHYVYATLIPRARAGENYILTEEP